MIYLTDIQFHFFCYRWEQYLPENVHGKVIAQYKHIAFHAQTEFNEDIVTSMFTV